MDLEEEFHQAVGSDDVEKVQQMLSTGFRCHGKNRDEEYPLWVAARRGNVRMLRALIEAEEHVDWGHNRSILYIAAEHGHADAVAYLGEKFDRLVGYLSDKRYRSPFLCAVSKGHVEVVRVLANLGTNLEDADRKGKNALIIATKSGDEEMVKALLETKIYIDKFDKKGRSALRHAMENRNLRIAEMLLKAGAIPSCSRDNSHYSAFGFAASIGYTSGLELMANYGVWEHKANRALEQAVSFGRHGAVKFLLGRGADPNHRTTCDKSLFQKCFGSSSRGIMELLVDAGADPNANCGEGTPLHIAVSREHPNLVKKLIAAGAVIDARIQRSGQTPLICAAFEEKTEIVKILVDAGADPNAIDNRKETPLLNAVSKSNADTIKVLLDAGADPNLPGAKSPLRVAAAWSKVKIAKLLVDAGADIDDVSDPSRIPPLGAAIERERSDMIDFLLKIGADPNVQGYSLNLAILQRNEDLTKKLLDNGADPNAPLDDRKSPLDAAWSNVNLGIVKVLLQAGADPATFGHRMSVAVGGNPTESFEALTMINSQLRVPRLSILCLRIIKLKRNRVHIPAWLPPILLAFPWEWERGDDESSKRSFDESEEESDAKRRK